MSLCGVGSSGAGGEACKAARVVWSECFGAPRKSGTQNRRRRIDYKVKRSAIAGSERSFVGKRRTETNHATATAVKRSRTGTLNVATQKAAAFSSKRSKGYEEFLIQKRDTAEVIEYERGNLLESEAHHTRKYNVIYIYIILENKMV